MINEARNFLRNRNSDNGFDSQYIPDEFHIFSFSEEVTSILSSLKLDPNFDDSTINYIVRHYLKILHAPDIQSKMIGDTRITYQPESQVWFLRLTRNPSWEFSYSGSLHFPDLYAEAELIDSDQGLDANIFHVFQISKDDGTHIRIASKNLNVLQAVAFDTSGRSQWIWADEPSLRFRLVSATASMPDPFLFKLTGMYNARLDLLKILETMAHKYQDVFRKWSVAFSMAAEWNLYQNGASMTERLGGLLLILLRKMRHEYYGL